MKTRIEYICEICGNRYGTPESAMSCEKRGHPAEYPEGMVLDNFTRGAFYKGIVFAIAQNGVDGHCNSPVLWVCRDNGAGDSLSKTDLCGGSNSFIPGKQDRPAASEAAFQRMIKLLQSFGFTRDTITVWDGTQPVPLKTFLKA